MQVCYATEDTEITEWIEKADRYGFLCVLCGSHVFICRSGFSHQVDALGQQ